MPIPCITNARPDRLRRDSRHGTVPKTRSMATDHDLHDEPTRPAHHVQRPFKSHETCSRHPCGQAGQTKPCGSIRHDTSKSLRTLSAMPSSMSSLHDNKRTGQRRPKGSHHCKLCLSSTDVSLDTKVWWSQTGSNRRPQACKASALPTELWPQFRHPDNLLQDWLA